MDARYTEQPPEYRDGQFAPLSCDNQGRIYVRSADTLDVRLDNVAAGSHYVSGVLNIANGAAVSDVVDARFARTITVFFPLAFDGAQVSFQMEREPGSGFVDVYAADGSLITLTVVLGGAVILPQGLCGMGVLRIRPGTVAMPVNQSAPRVLGFSIKG